MAYTYSSSEEDGDGGDPVLELDNAGTDTSSCSRSAYETGRAVSGPQVKVSTPNGLRLSRRAHPNSAGGVRGKTGVQGFEGEFSM